MKFASIIFTVLIAASSSLNQGFAVNRCYCCGTEPVSCRNISEHDQIGMSIIKNECCCTVKSSECGTPADVSTPPSVRVSIEPHFINYNKYDLFFTVNLSIFEFKHAREGPIDTIYSSSTIVPVYILNCSLLI